MATRRKPKAAGTARARSRSIGAAQPATDVTDLSAEIVIGRVKLLCDNQTNIVFFRNSGKLFMQPVPRVS